MYSYAETIANLQSGHWLPQTPQTKQEDTKGLYAAMAVTKVTQQMYLQLSSSWSLMGDMLSYAHANNTGSQKKCIDSIQALQDKWLKPHQRYENPTREQQLEMLGTALTNAPLQSKELADLTTAFDQSRFRVASDGFQRTFTEALFHDANKAFTRESARMGRTAELMPPLVHMLQREMQQANFLDRELKASMGLQMAAHRGLTELVHQRMNDMGAISLTEPMFSPSDALEPVKQDALHVRFATQYDAMARETNNWEEHYGHATLTLATIAMQYPGDPKLDDMRKQLNEWANIMRNPNVGSDISFE